MCLPHLQERYIKLLHGLSHVSLYIHIPLCKEKCDYCDFYSVPLSALCTKTKGAKIPQRAVLLDTITHELIWTLKQLPAEVTIDTIYIGGGTPSLISPKELRCLTKPLQPYVHKALEWSFEMNPRDVTPKTLKALQDCGINRISLGVQSFFENHRKAIGRVDSQVDPHKALELLSHKWGKGNRLSVDVIYGIPGQTVQEALQDLRQALQYEVHHISWYNLTYEEGTPLTKRSRQESSRLDNEIIAHIAEAGACYLQEQGFEQYEISSWGRKGDQSRHNLVYWGMGNWLGIGPGASGTISYLPDAPAESDVVTEYSAPAQHGMDPAEYSAPTEYGATPAQHGMAPKRALRINHTESLATYMGTGGHAQASASNNASVPNNASAFNNASATTHAPYGLQFEEVSPEELLQDTLIMGLRTKGGVSIHGLRQSFGSLEQGALQNLLNRLMVHWQDYFDAEAYAKGVLACNKRGFQFLDAILRDIINQ